MWNFVSIR